MSTVEQLPNGKEESGNRTRKRRFLLILITLIFLVLALIYAFYWFTIGRYYESTDDAYVNGNIIPITSQVGGTIIAVKTDDTENVTAGQILVELDPIDSYTALEQAKADLAETLRSTQQLFINNEGLEATITERKIAQAQARKDLLRRHETIGVGGVSQEDLTHAQDALQSAEASLIQARSALLANKALTENTNLPQHPNVQAATAKLRKAYIDTTRISIRAPLDGEIAKRNAQVGQRIGEGTQLMALVPLNQLWVDANFKEKQVRYMRVGQTVTLTADLYGSSVIYHGKILGFSAGTGSAFALLPAQNATGNWIKVVQRLPIRIALDPEELKKHPLRVGLSMEATVNLHDQNGKFINETTTINKTTIYDDLLKKSDVEIQKIITANINKTANLDLKVSLDKSNVEHAIKRSAS